MIYEDINFVLNNYDGCGGSGGVGGGDHEDGASAALTLQLTTLMSFNVLSPLAFITLNSTFL